MKAAESLALIIVLAVAAPVRATVIVNGDFSANAAAFTNSPGYTGGANPVTISNWLNYFNAPQQGLNGARTGVGNTFGPTNTGGRTYAFIQSAQTLLGQYLTLAPSTKYRLDYEVAARAGQAAKYRVMVAPSDSSGTSGLYYDSGVTAGNSAAFDHVTAYFTTPSALGASPNIQLWNSSDTGDSTISYANVSLSVTPRKAKLFLFAGQSNMVGMGDRNALTTEERQALTNVLVFVADPNHAPPQALSATRFWVPPQGYLSNYTAYGYAPGNAWNAVNPGHYDLVDNSYGPEYTTVRDIANALGETIYMAKYAQGGSGLDYSFGSYNASW